MTGHKNEDHDQYTLVLNAWFVAIGNTVASLPSICLQLTPAWTTNPAQAELHSAEPSRPPVALELDR